MTVTPAGWYPDPNDASLLRYWDGVAWTESTSPAAPATPAEPIAPAASYPPAAPAAPGALPTYSDYSGGYAQPGVPNPYVKENDSNVLSIIGIVCGAIAILFCPPLFGIAGLVLGFIARSKKERLANVALIVSGLGLALGMVIGFVVFNSM